MRLRCAALVLCLGVGCRGLETRPAPEEADGVAVPEVVAAKYEETPNPIPREDDALNLAAACIEKGDNAGAAMQFKKHLCLHPEQIMIRAYLAEILLKLRQLPEAQHQFESFIAAAQEETGPAKKHILHCHTRLMEIAQKRDDEYGEHLQRGIGMVLLARQLESATEREEVEPGFRERLLCKAATELTHAKRLRPDEPRPHCYLVEVFTKLDQPRSADKARQTARSFAALLPLPPAEQRSLNLARFEMSDRGR